MISSAATETTIRIHLTFDMTVATGWGEFAGVTRKSVQSFRELANSMDWMPAANLAKYAQNHLSSGV